MIAIYKVYDLMDKHPDHYKGNFIHATNNDVVAWLEDNGRVFLLNAKVQGAVLRMFEERTTETWTRNKLGPEPVAVQPDDISLPKWIAYTERVKRIFVGAV
jgi:ABC-type nitrate/sulfonate/bicarbonate transport system substrate-binding protein